MSGFICKCGERFPISLGDDEIICPACGQKWIYSHSLMKWVTPQELDERVRAIGVTNILQGKQRYLQIDYDIKTKEVILYEIQRLKDEYGLSVFIVMETKNGYHVISPHVLNRDECLEILRSTLCDELFIKKMETKGYTTLRISPKYIRNDRELIMVNNAPKYAFTQTYLPHERPICIDVIKLYEILSEKPIHTGEIPEQLIRHSPLQFVFYRTLKE